MNLWKKITFPRQPIRSVLFFAFGGLILFAVAHVLYLGLNFTTKLTKDYNHLLIETALNRLTDEVENLLFPVENQARWISDQVKIGNLDIENHAQVQTFFRGVISATPNVTGVGIQYPDGVARYLLRDENIWREDLEATPEETVKLFQLMDKVKTNVWGRFFWYEERKQTVVNMRAPLYQNGELKGVLFIGVTVADLSKTILTTSTDEFLTPFILYGTKHLLAHPLLTHGSTVSDEIGRGTDWLEGKSEVPLPRLVDFQDIKLNRLIAGPVIKAGLITPIQDVEVNRARIEDDLYIVATRKLERFGETPWITGVYINTEKSDRNAGTQLFEMAGAGFLILVISIVLSLKVGKKLARPIIRLADTAKKVRSGKFEDIEPLPRSRLRELDQAALAFNEMVEGMRERDIIREVFGRYVPESVAASLMQESGELKPISTQATILFSDLEGFTQLTEEVGPERIVAILNEYFSQVVEILERYGGVVTQFQGDAVLATFNVPIKAPDHAECALRAALEICNTLDTKTFDGIYLKSRIGLNTGTVVAGAVGAQGRLNYTVHGDAVNLASRIENLNKEFGTNILISEATAQNVKNIELRTIGTTTVRGLNGRVRLYVPKT
ncbi:adenylate/guanylate cyclase domain-containing protein [Terasakiella sp.]|uniref:adenylate/guanylate cyclase domain-containing protein n=1 Tax=Terasakiella sp. TaxID=2034861 RepID=UPI003AA7EAB8